MSLLFKSLILATSLMGCAEVALAQHYRQTGGLNTWTTNAVSRVNSADGELRIVRAAKQDGFDRVVFEFGDDVPSFLVSYPNGKTYDLHTQSELKISGTALIEVTFHFNYGEHIEIYQGFPKGRLDLPALLEIKNTDFSEGVMTFALGLPARHTFRVLTFSNPARLVVDIKH